MKRADHPKTCRVCHGTGWQEGPDIHSQADGQAVTYTTVEPCTHHWRDDQPELFNDG